MSASALEAHLAGYYWMLPREFVRHPAMGVHHSSLSVADAISFAAQSSGRFLLECPTQNPLNEVYTWTRVLLIQPWLPWLTAVPQNKLY